ncbi:MAG: hypothetical protein GY730_08560 [bacterium]|nr:hypothetical protein [bacterium]
MFKNLINNIVVLIAEITGIILVLQLNPLTGKSVSEQIVFIVIVAIAILILLWGLYTIFTFVRNYFALKKMK